MRTNRLPGITLALWLAATAAVSAQGNAHLGRWALQGAKSTFAEGMGRQTTLIYEAVGDKVKLTIDGVDHDAKECHGVWVGKFDGQFYPVKGSLLLYDALSLKAANANTNVLSVRRAEKVLWTGKSSVSRNGRTLTIAVSGKNPAGQEIQEQSPLPKEVV